jgi:diacylglycerol kinase
MNSSSSTPYRHPGMKGDFVAGMIAFREFGVMVRTTRPIHIQLILGSGVILAALLRPLYAHHGVGHIGWILVTIVTCLGASLECYNCVSERTGDAVAANVKAIRELRAALEQHQVHLPPNQLDQPIGEQITELNEHSRLIKDGGAGSMVPIFIMALVVDLVILFYG